MAVTDETAKDVIVQDSEKKPLLYDSRGHPLMRPLGFRAQPLTHKKAVQ